MKEETIKGLRPWIGIILLVIAIRFFARWVTNPGNESVEVPETDTLSSILTQTLQHPITSTPSNPPHQTLPPSPSLLPSQTSTSSLTPTRIPPLTPTSTNTSQNVSTLIPTPELMLVIDEKFDNEQPNLGFWKEISCDDGTVEILKGEIFFDMTKNERSGHTLECIITPNVIGEKVRKIKLDVQLVSSWCESLAKVVF